MSFDPLKIHGARSSVGCVAFYVEGSARPTGQLMRTCWTASEEVAASTARQWGNTLNVRVVRHETVLEVDANGERGSTRLCSRLGNCRADLAQ